MLYLCANTNSTTFASEINDEAALKAWLTIAERQEREA